MPLGNSLCFTSAFDRMIESELEIALCLFWSDVTRNIFNNAEDSLCSYLYDTYASSITEKI
jgi:hypothetical protein